MDLPPRGASLVPGTFVLPEAIREGERLVYREPLSDTLVPLAALSGIDLALCVGVAAAGPMLRVPFVLGASGVSFLVAALAFSLFRRPEVVLDRAAGTLRARRPEHAPLDVPLGELRAVTVETVEGGGLRATAAGLATRGGAWIPLHVGWTPRRGGGPERTRAVAEEVGAWLGLPVEIAPGGVPVSGPAPG